MNNDYNKALFLLRNGKAPGNSQVLDNISVGIDFVTDFWETHYLMDYIAAGGSRVQFVTGRPGSGKTHFIEYYLNRAKSRYKTVFFSAADIWLNDFKEIYFEIFRQCDLMGCLKLCADNIITDMGYDPGEVPESASFIDHLSEHNLNNPITKREIRQQLNSMFLQNPRMDNNFAIACSLLTGGLLGHPMLEEHSREVLLGWLEGKKEVKLSELRHIGLSPARITKFNARHMLRSLVEIVKLAGYPGVIVAIDDVDILVSRESVELRYTRLKRDDAYESIRELIDSIDTLGNIKFIFAFDRKLIDDEANGIKSYQALWFRIQNEIVSDPPNRFANILDLDGLNIFDVDTVVSLSEKIARILGENHQPLMPIDADTASELIASSRYSNTSLPRRVVTSTVTEIAEELGGV